ncbi:hypothetical protein AK88_05053 [Plasmodium fragile]|uniref:Schizont-infected cell agglutination extracellular alpha domain-containing protein n=1 Tax=Plasmodium fragile TaxID=5857 RepID=A0A0D9QE32_PLAFR|nr:uncharacterized protein AK88_05053 [Plasmodium fragile]KJP85320.1 hypothetical protein AK88_05053 [Plasmodium fragile]
MMFALKLSICSFILYSWQYPEHVRHNNERLRRMGIYIYDYDANEFGTSWKHSAEQQDILGVRMSRLLTVELDMQAPAPNNTLLLSPGKGHDKKLASGQKPGKSGKPTTNVASEGSLPQSPQTEVQSEQKEKKAQGTEVKNGTDKQTPEQNKAPATPSAGPVKATATGTDSGKSKPKDGSEGLVVASEKKAQIKETSEKTRGLCSTLARTICRNKCHGEHRTHAPHHAHSFLLPKGKSKSPEETFDRQNYIRGREAA